MLLEFSLDYRTDWGENISVMMTSYRRNARPQSQTYVLETHDGEKWTGEVSVTTKDLDYIMYEYAVCRGAEVVRREWNAVPRRVDVKSGVRVMLLDYWRDIPELSHLYSSAYTRCFSHVEECARRLVYFNKTIVFRVMAPQLRHGESLALLGSQPPLGAWMPERCIRMERAGCNEWVMSVSAEGLYLPFEYKYVVVDDKTGALLRWEEGDNRQSPHCNLTPDSVAVVYDRQLHICEDEWKTAGVVIPVFSLRSESSQGVGDFGDLRKLADWAARVGMHVIQLLPVYDTVQTHTWRDCYPYSAISVYAFHPMYTDISSLPQIKDAGFMKKYGKKRAELNALPQVDYEAVCSLKDEYLRRLYEQEGDTALTRDEFKAFYNRNEEWLLPYSVFCLLRDTYGTCDYTVWPKYSVYEREKVEQFARAHKKETLYYAYVQFLLDGQLTSATLHARSLGVFLKGDIPIGISRHSVEAWTEPCYFNMNGQAGAPPDAFSANGQNWGFPTYNWRRMAEDGYSWWVKRLRKMGEYFDAFRIDHVLGFFRIWQIPLHSVHALLGHFSPSLPMSVEEIESYGMTFRKEEWTRPYITDCMVADIFGNGAEYVRYKFLDRRDDGRYDMKKDFATQRQVKEYFGKKQDKLDVDIREGLYRLISDVLFVEDEDVPGTYHPRIAAMDDYAFQSLSAEEQDAFRRIHEQYYYHRHNEFWYTEAMAKLPALVQSTRMLVCAEDLGMVPACVQPCMERLRMLSLEIQAMPKSPGLMFARLQDNPYRSVSTVFTHDMPTLRGWWEEDYGRAQRFYNQVLGHGGVAPSVMTASLCEEVVAAHLASPSMLCIISWQDWMSIDTALRFPHPEGERINIPSDPHHYWRYRMHISIDKLMREEQLNGKIRSMIAHSGR